MQLTHTGSFKHLSMRKLSLSSPLQQRPLPDRTARIERGACRRNIRRQAPSINYGSKPKRRPLRGHQRWH